jgi:amino acid adenylation domain-containing protein/non-ribosomal peptide synthase protein (TIGR01720 family)
MTDLIPSTLVALLRRRALSEPDRLAYRFLTDGEVEGQAQLTYFELDRQARAVAAFLQEQDARGERALLLYPAGLDYVAAFFGCLYAGVIAVPAFPPRMNRNPDRLQAMASDAGATLALTTLGILTRIENSTQQPAGFDHLRWIATDALRREPGKLDQQWKEPEGLDHSSLAYLQYTSGSTAAPKGVMVSHGNVLHNSADIHEGFAHTPESVSLTWLPHFHDMGLIDGIIQPLYGGFPGILMSPASFLQRPGRWLEAISQLRVTHTGGPNFAYDLCVRRVKEGQRDLLDLSSWRVAYNGSEPIHKETLDRFAETFEPCGFRWTSFYPAYGLAEATLKVSGKRASEAPRLCAVQVEALAHNLVREASPDEPHARTLVGVGEAARDTEVRIVNPETLLQCRPYEVGEIWVRGPGVAGGYWNRREETAQTFEARLAETLEGPFLRTGDLGFVKDGALFITGRLKDLIIIRGRNHYPQDIELIVERSHPVLRPGGGAAFSVESGGEERLIVAQEVEPRQQGDWQSVLESIRGAVVEEFEVQPAAILLLKPGSLPKTSSGKRQRNAAREKFLRHDWETLAEWRASTGVETLSVEPSIISAPSSKETIEDWLRATLAAKLKIAPDEIDVNRPLAPYGVDSLIALELLHSIQTHLRITLPIADLLHSPSISELAAQAFESLSSTSSRSEAVFAVASAETAASATAVTEHSLSHNQQSLWFLHKLAPESTAYNLSFAVGIHERLDVAALHRTFQALVMRHPSLRATFPARHAEPVQRVQGQATVFFEVEEAAGWTDASLHERLRVESQSPFNLESGPLFRVFLFKRATEEHVLLLVAHHIIIDFWSLAVLMQDLGTTYSAEINGTRASLAAQNILYADYVRWQREMLASAEGERLRGYWQQQLAGELPHLDLPTNQPRPLVQTYRGASISLRLNADLTGKLKSLGDAHHATLYTTLLAAFQVLLYRYTGQEDVLVGSPASGRTAAQFSRLVGYLVNPVVLRGRLPGEMAFTELLAQIRETVIAALAHQDYPFALLVKHMQPERDPSRSPLFQVMFALHKAQLLDEEGLAAFALGEAGAQVRLNGLLLESIALDQRISQFDLSLTVAEAHGELAAVFEYNSDLFDAETIERMSRHFHTLLEAITGNPRQSLARLQILTEPERHQLSGDWQSSPRATLPGPCVQELFERRAGHTPEHPAVVCNGEQLSYRELNARANQLAHHLRATGVGPDVPVALCMERSIEMIVSLLAILKVGGAYVPLDPAYPLERLAFMLEDTGSPLLLTQQHLLDQLPPSRAQVMCLEKEWHAVAQESELNLNVKVEADNLAYVIYTSGSTGQPKGVMISHGSLTNYTEVALASYAIRPSDRVLQFASFSFDASAEEVFPCLAAGATLVLRSDEMSASPSAFLRECVDRRLTVLNFPTAFWHQLVAGLSADDWAQAELVRLVIIGGEKALPERLSQWQESVGQRVRLVNTYGPTETTIVATMCDVQEMTSANGSLREVPIGRPIRDAQIYILDQHSGLVPRGVKGELYIGGPGLGRGYLNLPALTAGRFIPHPFSDIPGARLYKTGDLVRCLPDGNLEFVGRLDQQVKVRGYRIEPGEIEAALAQHPNVREGIVIPREEEPGEKRLIAYLVTEQGQTLAINELRGFLKERLPEYMLPSAYIFLEALPLTPTGKIDYRALSSIEPTRHDLKNAFVAPQTKVEHLLSDIWANVLKLQRVGIHDNFFELGGDSILSIQVIARAQQAGIHLAAKQMFTHPTVAGLAAVAGAAQTTLAEQPESMTGDAPLTPIQHWFFSQEFAAPDHWNMTVLLETLEPLDAQLLERALAHLLNHHDALRARFSRESDGWHQFIAEPLHAGVKVHQIDLSALAEAEQQSAIEALVGERQSALNITRGPLLQTALFDLGEDRPQRLLILVHHLVIDGVSWRILLEDLSSVYRQLQRYESIKLPPKTISFKLWAARLSAFAQSATLSEELDYWTNLATTEVNPLPLDGAGGSNTEGTARTISMTLNAEETSALLLYVPGVYHTQINDVLLTALVEAYRRWSGDEVLLLELEGHGREEIFAGVDLSRTVGWLTSAFPVLLKTDASFEPGAALKSIKEQLRRIPGHGIGYGALRYLNERPEIAAKLSALPAPQMSFNYLGQLDHIKGDASLFDFARESSGPSRHESNQRAHLLEVNASVRDHRLRLDWTSSEEAHASRTIETLAQDYMDALRTIIRHCLSPEAGGYTPSDFPLARLDQRRLDELLKSSGPVADLYPLSPMQQGMLFHSLYAPEKEIYTGQLSCVLHGDLSAKALAQAWQQAASRHEILRASFLWENLDEPLQLVRRDVRLPLDQDDWRGLPATEQERRLTSLLVEEQRRGFDLDRAPLMRLKLIRIAEDAYQFILTHHHLLLDGWSLALLLREVLTIHGALQGGDDLPVERVRPFRDYIEWLRQQDTSGAEMFWRETLKGFAAPTRLTFEKAMGHEAPEPKEVVKQELRFSTEATARLQAFVRQHQLTLNTLVQGAYALLLSRYSLEDEVVYGTTVSGRPPSMAGVDSMIGLFINTLPVRVRVSFEEPALRWLEELQGVLAGLREYEFSSLAEVQGWSDVGRGQALFESLLIFENYPVETALLKDGAGLKIGEIRSFEQTNYPLTLIALPGPELNLQAIYTEERFDDGTIQRFLEHWQTLLLNIVVDATQALADVQLLGESERQQLLFEWNETGCAYPQGLCIHELFEAQAERTPHALAAAFVDPQGHTLSLTYAELNGRANQLAHYLRGLGVGPEIVVGICLERSLEMLVGLLGILKAGGAYLPLDPAYPVERLSFMLEDSQAAVLLTQQSLARLQPPHDVRLVCLDTDWRTIALDSEENLRINMAADNLAYVIYTSGSTGRPKGVAICHRSAVTLLYWTKEHFTEDELMGVLASTSISFDISVFELFGALSWGGTVLLTQSALELPSLAAPAEVTLINTVPSVMTELLRLGSVPHSVRVVNLAGEPLSRRLVESVYESAKVEKVLNLYGPSEDTTYSTWTQVSRWAASEPTIGRPLANTQIYILDERMHPVPVGVAGEIYIGGEGLARGYFRRPELTAEKFVPHPFTIAMGARLYRTQDLARFRADGEIEYLGRVDQQVKVRGFRIELGEIEALLAQHASVREAVVIAHQDTGAGASTADTLLVAYLVAETSRQASSALAPVELRAFLQQSLPDYMLPSSFVLLDGLPLTPSGKVDRRALPVPAAMRDERTEVFVAPRTPVEEVLCDIWSEVLGLERVGVQDDFFELGGHSLMATRVLSSVRRIFRLELPLQVLFGAHTIAELALALTDFEAQPGQIEKIARVMQKLKRISAEDVRTQLDQKRRERIST